MGIPQAQLTLQNNKLARAAAQSDGVIAILAFCTLGIVGSVYDLSNASPEDVVATLGQGKGSQLSSMICSTENHSAIVVVPIASTPGVAGSVTSSGSSPPVVGTSGNPYDDGKWKVQIIQPGARGTATFKYSRDNGKNWSDEIVTAATVAIALTGITLTFATGTNYSSDNLYTFDAAAPTHSNSNITAGFDVLKASGRDIGWVMVMAAPAGVDDTARGTAMASQFAAVSTKCAELTTAFRYVGFTLEGPSPIATDVSGMTAWRAAQAAYTPALADLRGMIATGYGVRLSNIDGLSYRRNAIFAVAAKITAAPISEDLGRVASGALIGWSSIEHDEEAVGGLSQYRLTTLRTIAGETGFFLTEGRQFDAPNGDYQLTQAVRVINHLSKIGRGALVKKLNDSTIADKATGKIREAEAAAIDQEMQDAAEASLIFTDPQHASSVSARVSRNDDLAGGAALTGEFAAQGLLYFKDIRWKIGFTRTNVASAA
jgi:hypothetical protein